MLKKDLRLSPARRLSFRYIVTVLGLVGGVPGGETPRVADSSAAGAGRFFHKRTS